MGLKVEVLDQRHPSYNRERLRRQRALYQGGDAWQELVAWWLPRHPEEAPESYEHRKARALYENHAGPIVDIMASAVFTEAPQVDVASAGKWLEGFLANVDGQGTPVAPWFRERLVDLLVDQRTFVWTNLPARSGEPLDSLAAEEQAGALDPFFVSLHPSSVIDWGTDEKGRLSWLMSKDVVHERPTVEAGYTTLHRWTYIDATTIRRWVWEAKSGEDAPSANTELEEQPPVLHGFGELPVAMASLTDGMHAMGKLHDPAVAHLRARNDLSWALHRSAHALLVLKRLDDGTRPVLGAGYYLSIGRDDDASYVEPSGTNFALLRDDVTDLREEMYRVVHQMAQGAGSNSTRAKMSGESKSQDWKAMEIVLSALAAQMRSLISESIRLAMLPRRVQDKPNVEGLDGWSEEDIEAWLRAAAMALDAHQLSPTFKRAVAKRQAQRVLQDTDPKVLATIDSEIDAAEVNPALYAPPPGLPPEPDPLL
jgi:hypothetical protein